jgi:serine/threonine protein kinase
MSITQCPDENVIAQFLQGHLPAQAAAALEQHVDRCRDCAGLLSELARLNASRSASVPATAPLGSGPLGSSLLGSAPLGAAPFGSQAQPHSSHPSPPSGAAHGTAGSGITLAAPLTPGQVIGRYIIERQVGAGAIGVVYLAVDKTLGRRVALKVLRPDILASAEAAGDAKARLVREARIMAQLAHPNVVPIYDAGMIDDHVFLAMEFVEGQSLAEWLRGPKRGSPAPSWREIMRLFQSAGEGLAAAHDAGIIHRDFKPANVLVGVDGRVRVTDFGLARSSTPNEAGPTASAATSAAHGAHIAPPHADPAATVAGMMIGTPAYMAPEQLFSQPVDARVDQWGFCVALYEALYGARPYVGSTIQEIRWYVASGVPIWPSNHRGVPEAVAAVLMRGLRTRPAERFMSMRELLAALDVAKGHPEASPILANTVFQALAGLLHLGAVAFYVDVLTDAGPASVPTPSSATTTASDSDAALGAVLIIYLLIMGGWAAFGVVWAPLNAVGLWRRAAWARKSAMIYAGLAVLSCIGLPYGIYALWSLTRPEVREAFQRS